MTPCEVAERPRLNPFTIRRRLREGTLRGTPMGGKRGGYRIGESEVQRFLAVEGAAPKAVAS
jgi:excisionase family DNA binding protein